MLTLEFLRKHLGDWGSKRYKEQMEQAARSGKQNIAEGYSQKTSLKGYIKLLGVAKGSLEELKLDYEDYLKRNNLEIWGKEHPKIREFRGFRVKILGKKGNEILYNLPKFPNSPQESANLLITLISQNTYLLDKQIRSLIQKHKTEGGFTEKLYSTRTSFRKSQ